MRIETNSADFSKRHRVRKVREIIENADCGGNIYPYDDDLLSHAVTNCFGASFLTDSRHSRLRFERTRQKTSLESSDYAAFWLGSSGRIGFEQGGREAQLKRGEIIALNGRAPMSCVNLNNPVSFLNFLVPISMLGTRRRLIEDCSAVSLGPGDPVQRVACDYLASLNRQAASLDDVTAQSLFKNGADLLCLVMERGTGHFRKTAPSAYKFALIRRIKHYMACNMGNPRLSIATTAEAIGISERYVNMLLNIEDTSFGKYLIEQRLEQCRIALIDPARRSSNISEIIYDWGFINQAHFSRIFRQRYGAAPRDYRALGSPNKR